MAGIEPTVQQQTGSNYRTGASDRFVYPREVGSTTNEYPHYIRFIARKSYTSSAQSRRGTPNGEVVLYMPPDALKTTYTQGIGDVDMGGFISLAMSAGGAGSELAAGKFGIGACLLYTSPSPRDGLLSRMPSSA